jgi:hypothetical protein
MKSSDVFSRKVAPLVRNKHLSEPTPVHTQLKPQVGEVTQLMENTPFSVIPTWTADRVAAENFEKSELWECCLKNGAKIEFTREVDDTIKWVDIAMNNNLYRLESGKDYYIVASYNNVDIFAEEEFQMFFERK